MLIDLSEISGLPLKLEGNSLIFGEGIKKTEPDIRTRERMKDVLMDPNADAPEEFYYMYRDVHLEKDKEKIKGNDLRYDITLLPSFSAGEEYNKTFGHFHPKIQEHNTWYPEVYEVLHGRALYLLTNKKEFLVYDAREGDKCLMLPGFAHVTVNPGKETLVMSNWVYPGFESQYGPIKEKKGVEYYYTERGFLKNNSWESHPPIKLIQPKKFSEFGFTKKPMYKEAMKAPEKFSFLSKPEEFGKDFQNYLKL